jgi:dephospho-CoA kinase
MVRERMSAWPGKYVIGLTGNIATGKSVVRKMLEHLGAYGIDADALAHRAMAQDAPGYAPILEAFGRRIVAPDGQIDRARLARLVFADPEALSDLESILHPLVRQAIDSLARRAKHPVIVIEAIKLLEGPLKQACDSIWVSTAPAEVQLVRLVQKRGMSAEAARQRIDAQPAQEDKLVQADVIIYTDGSFERVWHQVTSAWRSTVPGQAVEAERTRPARRGLQAEHGGPRQADEIAAFITRLSNGRRSLDRGDVMAAFGERAFLLLRQDGSLAGLAGWQVENLVARTAEVYLEPGLPYGEAMRVMMEEIERASAELLCEVSLVFLPPHLARNASVWQPLGYDIRPAKSLGVRAWEEAAVESMPAGTVLLFKQLRKDRVLRPV